jgi:hypothetical protein
MTSWLFGIEENDYISGMLLFSSDWPSWLGITPHALSCFKDIPEDLCLLLLDFLAVLSRCFFYI